MTRCPGSGARADIPLTVDGHCYLLSGPLPLIHHGDKGACGRAEAHQRRRFKLQLCGYFFDLILQPVPPSTQPAGRHPFVKPLPRKGEDRHGTVPVEHGANGEIHLHQISNPAEELLDGSLGPRPVADLHSPCLVVLRAKSHGEQPPSDLAFDAPIRPGKTAVQQRPCQRAFEESRCHIGLVPQGHIVVWQAGLGQG